VTEGGQHLYRDQLAEFVEPFKRVVDDFNQIFGLDSLLPGQPEFNFDESVQFRVLQIRVSVVLCASREREISLNGTQYTGEQRKAAYDFERVLFVGLSEK